MIEFPSQIYIEQIREHLWRGDFGGAAVMVGAGFSRNAEKMSSRIPDFPLLKEIAEQAFDALYPKGSIDEEQRQRSRIIMTSGVPLRLMSEYEAAFTRPTLDDLLINTIPDNAYRPGDLHRMLLALPWTDVFTTNYDTLLERTRPFVHDRKYDLVLNTSDIPLTSRPRIVKLHGSFPSHRPFAITEEDFRTYPRQRSPFVNLVQQSIMENVFCLIGFSGDDPNFLNWTGWVRDHLGDHAQAIYLCGILNLSAAQRKMLEGRKVIPIDLSPLFPASKWSNPAIRHTKALEWFLLTLLHGAPPNTIHWPKSLNKTLWKPSDGLPAILPAPLPLSPLGDRIPQATGGRLAKEELINVCSVWKKKREEYPGWVVLPQNNRKALWEHTKYWIDPILVSIGQLDSPQNISLLYELNWRLNRTLSPWPISHAKKIQEILDQFNPFPDRYSNQRDLRPDRSEYSSWDWQNIGLWWIELTFAVIRTWRENLDGPRFLSEMEKIKEVVKHSPEWQSRWYHEYCLFFLAQSDFTRVRKILTEWEAATEVPFWEARKAAVMAEVGDLEPARKLAENALAAIRNQMMPGTTDYALFSQEGWTMLLLRGIRMNSFGDDSGYVDQFTDRWEMLATHRCNPWTEIETLETIVKGMTPIKDIERETRRGYYPKSETITYHMMAETAYSKLQPAFNFLRIFEEGGIPIRAGATALFTDAVLNAARCITEFAPGWALSSRLRANTSPETDNWLELAAVAVLQDDEVAYLYQIFRTSLIEALNHLARHPEEIGGFWASTPFRRVLTFADLLSRLAPRLNEQQLDEMLRLALDVYQSPVARSHHTLHKCHAVLFERGLSSTIPNQQAGLLQSLLSLPIPGEAGFDVSSPEQWHEPFMYLRLTIGLDGVSSPDRTELTAAIANLIRITRHGVKESRWRAILRLSHLHEAELLTEQEIAEFSDALWSRLDDSGLPADTNSLRSGALLLPEPQPGIAKEKLKHFLLSTDFYRKAQKFSGPNEKGVSVGLSFGQQNLILELCQATSAVPSTAGSESKDGIDWNREETTLLFDRVRSWWDDQKDFLNGPVDFPLALDELHRDLSGLIDILRKVILPRIEYLEEQHQTAAVKMITELDEAKINILAILPAVLPASPALYDFIAERIQVALFSNDQDQVEGAMLGLRDWFVYSQKAGLVKPPSHFFDHLINIVAGRKQPALDSALMYVGDLLKSVPQIFEEKHLELILVGLDRLIEETNVRSNLSAGNTQTPDKPHVRYRAAKLAYQVSQYYEQIGQPLPGTVNKWQVVCQSDPIAYVRRLGASEP